MSFKDDERVPRIERDEDARIVPMSELEDIWAEQKRQGVLYNGCTNAWLYVRYGERLFHVWGVGWFVRNIEEGLGQ